MKYEEYLFLPLKKTPSRLTVREQLEGQHLYSLGSVPASAPIKKDVIASLPQFPSFIGDLG